MANLMLSENRPDWTSLVILPDVVYALDGILAAIAMDIAMLKRPLATFPVEYLLHLDYLAKMTPVTKEVYSIEKAIEWSVAAYEMVLEYYKLTEGEVTIYV